MRWWEKTLKPNMIEINSTQEVMDTLSNAGDRLVIVEFIHVVVVFQFWGFAIITLMLLSFFVGIFIDYRLGCVFSLIWVERGIKNHGQI